jgi:hypothetical protein
MRRSIDSMSDSTSSSTAPFLSENILTAIKIIYK